MNGCTVQYKHENRILYDFLILIYELNMYTFRLLPNYSGI